MSDGPTNAELQQQAEEQERRRRAEDSEKKRKYWAQFNILKCDMPDEVRT